MPKDGDGNCYDHYETMVEVLYEYYKNEDGVRLDAEMYNVPISQYASVKAHINSYLYEGFSDYNYIMNKRNNTLEER